MLTPHPQSNTFETFSMSLKYADYKLELSKLDVSNEIKQQYNIRMISIDPTLRVFHDDQISPKSLDKAFLHKSKYLPVLMDTSNLKYFNNRQL